MKILQETKLHYYKNKEGKTIKAITQYKLDPIMKKVK